MCLLLIDDERQVVEDLEEYLKDRFHVVSIGWIEDRDGFVEVLEGFDPPPTLAVLDFEMEPAGDEIYRWLKEWNPRLHVVFYTRYARTPDRQRRMLAVGAQARHIIEKVSMAQDVPKLLRALGR